MSPVRYVVVVLNPVAGRRKAAGAETAVRAAFASSGLPFEVVRTEGPRHAVELAREAATRADVVVAAGGDGTVQEVASGLLDEPGGTTLGVLPLGTGNDYATLLGVPERPEAAVRALLRAAPISVDAGQARWREETGGPWFEAAFINALGIGFDALVAAEAARFKRLGGFRAYLAGILSALVRWPSPRVTALRCGPSARVLPGGETTPTGAEGPLHEGPLFLAAAANGRSVGGGFRLTPHASVSDGLLDLCFVAAVRKRRLPVLIPQVLRGAHLGAPEAICERLQGLRLVSAGVPLPIHLDGEVLSTRAVEVEARVLPRALRVLCPAAGHGAPNPAPGA